MLLSRLTEGPAASLGVLVLAVALPACSAYQPPSGRGYDYDRGQAVARNDVRAGHLIYLVTGSDAAELPALSARTARNCGFRIVPAPSGRDADARASAYAQGYNAISVPVIEQRLGAPIAELLRRCSAPAEGAR